MTSRNPSTGTVAIPVIAFAVVLLAWHWLLLIAAVVALCCAWASGWRSGRRGVVRRVGRGVR